MIGNLSGGDLEESIVKLYRMLKYVCSVQERILLEEYELDTSKSVTIIKRYPIGMVPTIYGTECRKKFKDYHLVLIIDFPHKYRFKPIYHEKNNSGEQVLHASILEITDLENNSRSMILTDNYDNEYNRGTIIPNPIENILDPYLNEASVLSISDVDLFVGKKRSKRKSIDDNHVIGISYVVKKNGYYRTTSTVIILSGENPPQALLRIYASRELADALSLGAPVLLEPLGIYLTIGEIDFTVLRDFIENIVLNEVTRILMAVKILGSVAREKISR